MKGKKTGGRKPGSLNKNTVFKRELASEGYKNAVEKGIMPLEVVFMVMRGGEEGSRISERQFEAAKAALPYCHPRLTATYVSASFNPNGTMSHEDRVRRLLELERGPPLPEHQGAVTARHGPDIDGQAVVVIEPEGEA